MSTTEPTAPTAPKAHTVSYRIARPSNALPHIEWFDIANDGTFKECAVIRRDRVTGTVVYMEVNDLDGIDKERLHRILVGRYSRQSELWELMQQTTLPNGVNAYTYFLQLAKQLLPNGQVVPLSSRLVGSYQAK